MLVGGLPPTLPLNCTDPPAAIFAGVGMVVIEQLAAWALDAPSTASVHSISPAETVDRKRCARDIGISPLLLFDIPVVYNGSRFLKIPD
jgi:hypothetical protein